MRRKCFAGSVEIFEDVCLGDDLGLGEIAASDYAA